MLIKEIEADATLDIRHRVLWPDKPREFSLVDGDQSATHYGLFHNDELIGVASVFEIAGSVRLRKFAIDTAYQRRGYGTALLQHVIGAVRTGEASHFWCDARESAMSIYANVGMSVDGERFYKSEIPYFRMSLAL